MIFQVCPICNSNVNIFGGSRADYERGLLINEYKISCSGCKLQTHYHKSLKDANAEWQDLTKQHEGYDDMKKQNNKRVIQMPTENESALIKSNVETMEHIVTQNRDILCKEIKFLEERLVEEKNRSENIRRDFFKLRDEYEAKESQIHEQEVELKEKWDELNKAASDFDKRVWEKADVILKQRIHHLRHKFWFYLFYNKENI